MAHHMPTININEILLITNTSITYAIAAFCFFHHAAKHFHSIILIRPKSTYNAVKSKRRYIKNRYVFLAQGYCAILKTTRLL